MKTFIFLLLFAVSASAQSGYTKLTEPVKISQINVGGVSNAWLTYFPQYEIYSVSFRNMFYSSIYESDHFFLDLEEYSELIKLIEMHFGTQTKMEKRLSDNQLLNIEFTKNTVKFWVYKLGNWSYSSHFTYNQIIKLLPSNPIKN